MVAWIGRAVCAYKAPYANLGWVGGLGCVALWLRIVSTAYCGSAGSRLRKWRVLLSRATPDPRSAVTRNYSEKVINKVLDLVSNSQQMDLLQNFYETTLVALQEV
jgi:hypothetical protein